MSINTVSDVRQYFIDELSDEVGVFIDDKSGQKVIELIGASFMATEPFIFGTVNQDYVDAEIKWYESQSTNIYDIYKESGADAPAAWKYTANTHGEINSNYGYLIYSDKFYNQYGMVLDELLTNIEGRRATMVYNRPSIWVDYNDNNKNDFICTNAVTYYVRSGRLHAVVQMRSNDVIYGYKNDYAWQRYVLEKLCFDFTNADRYVDGRVITPGEIIWQVQNLHVYEKHFHLVK